MKANDVESPVLGAVKYAMVTENIATHGPIERIVIFKKNNQYMRGFKIFFRNQQVVLIGSETGIECGTVTFQDND